MITKEIQVKAPHGLHLRVAAKIVAAIKQAQSKVIFHKDDQQVDGSSILGLLSLGVQERSRLKVTATGEDEHKAIEQVTEILMDGAGI